MLSKIYNVRATYIYYGKYIARPHVRIIYIGAHGIGADKLKIM